MQQSIHTIVCVVERMMEYRMFATEYRKFVHMMEYGTFIIEYNYRVWDVRDEV